jgi:hypothetical protein
LASKYFFFSPASSRVSRSISYLYSATCTTDDEHSVAGIVPADRPVTC